MLLVVVGRELVPLPSRGTHPGRQDSMSIERTVSLNPGTIMSKTKLVMAFPRPHSPGRGDTGGSCSPHWIFEAGR